MPRPMSMTTKPMSLQRASYVVAAFSLLGFSAFHCGFAAQSDFVRFSKPELLTARSTAATGHLFDEIRFRLHQK